LHTENKPYAIGRSIVDGGANYFGNAGVALLSGRKRAAPNSTI
jgi:hypothetical protein